MCRKIRCDGKSWNFFGFWAELNKEQNLFKISRHLESYNTYMEH